MTRDEVLRHLCKTVALVYKSLDDFSHPSDGFCDLCPNAEDPVHFRHAGKTLEWLRRAAVEKLARDGVKVAEGFDPVTGAEISDEPDEVRAAKRRLANRVRRELDEAIRRSLDEEATANHPTYRST